MNIGVVVPYTSDLMQVLIRCKETGIESIQLSVPYHSYTEETRLSIKSACERAGIYISALVATWSGPKVWNFIEGPITLGIVPVAYRMRRLEEIYNCGKFAKELGVTDICCHMGFIPENVKDPLYGEFIAAAHYLAVKLDMIGINLLFETGQETPITMFRAIQDIESENVGVNFDPANLLMYGKANPIDALDILGEYVKGVHMKDGQYPTDGFSLGQEKPYGEGMVDFKALVAKLRNYGYQGALTIEREISGEEQWRDIESAVKQIGGLL